MLLNIFENVILFTKLYIQYIKFRVNIIDFNSMVKNMCNDLSKTNIFYMKCIQWGIQDIYEIDDELKYYFNQFSNNVPYIEEDIDKNVFHRIQKYTKLKNIDFSLDSYIPINSGVVALVFKGKLNNKPIIIKILRKNISLKIKKGIQNILALFNIINFVFSFLYKTKLNTIEIIKNNQDLLLEQCDFENEIKNLELFKENFKSSSHIVIPSVYKEFNKISSDIIVMDLLEGSLMSKLTINEIKPYYSLIRTFVFETVLIYGLIHADLHLGNIILLNDNKIGIIDFGLVIKNSKFFTNCFFSILLGIKNSNKNLILDNLLKIVVEKKEDIIIIKEKVYKSSELICNSLEKIKTKDILELLKLIETLNIKINSLLCKNLLSVISCVSLLERIGEKQDLKILFREYLANSELSL